MEKKEVVINSSSAAFQRVLIYLSQVDNPYSLNMEGYHVELEWANTGATLQNRLEELFASF